LATRFGYRLARAREGSQHRGMPVRYLLEDKNGVTPFRSLEEVERKLIAMAKERTSAGSEVTCVPATTRPERTEAAVNHGDRQGPALAGVDRPAGVSDAALGGRLLRRQALSASCVYPLVWFTLARARWAYPDMKLPPASEMRAGEGSIEERAPVSDLELAAL
jgi:hypothetical protein